MTEKINRRGVKTPDVYEPDTLRAVTVRELLTPANGQIASSPACHASDDAGLAAEMMGQYNTESIAVKDDMEDEKIIGVITARSILQYYSHQRQRSRTISHRRGRDG